jgi:hypothetical protein
MRRCPEIEIARIPQASLADLPNLAMTPVKGRKWGKARRDRARIDRFDEVTPYVSHRNGDAEEPRGLWSRTKFKTAALSASLQAAWFG